MSNMLNNKLSSLEDFFVNTNFKNFYYHRYPGNNGDDLIDLGTQIFFKQNHIQTVKKIEDCDCIILSGGGGIVKQWHVGIEFLSFANIRYPQIPIVVLPSSLGEGDLDLVENFKKRTAPFYIWARERYTYQILMNYDYANFYIGLDHDMALYANDYLKTEKTSAKIKYILLVERVDFEDNVLEVSIKKKPSKFKQTINFLKKLIPLEIKRYIKRNTFKPNWRQRKFVGNALKEIYDDFPEARNLNIKYCDISLTSNASFKKFLDVVRNASFIATTRLHVGILGYIFKKPTYFKIGETIPHKIKGVYEYSLKSTSSVKLLK